MCSFLPHRSAVFTLRLNNKRGDYIFHVEDVWGKLIVLEFIKAFQSKRGGIYHNFLTFFVCENFKTEYYLFTFIFYCVSLSLKSHVILAVRHHSLNIL